MSFSLSELDFADILDRTPNGVLIVEKNGTIVFTNNRTIELFGHSREELVGNSVDVLVPQVARGFHHRNRDGYSEAPYARNFPAHLGLHGQHKNGTLIPVEISLLPIDSKSGPKILVSIVDISERRKQELFKETLVHELNHRVKNNMALVSSIATLTRKSAENVEEYYKSFNSRLMALSGAHDLISQGDWNATRLQNIVEMVVAPFNMRGQVEYDGPSMLIPAEHIPPISMLFHELTTNSVKYGALKVPEGRVEIKWWFEHGLANVTWIESGLTNIREPARKGFGTVLMERTVQSFNGTLTTSFTETGLHVHVQAPPIAE